MDLTVSSEISVLRKGSRPASRRLLAGAGVLGLLLSAEAPAQVANGHWNLPYQRPAGYDYSQYYAPNMNVYLSVKADFFKAELKMGWNFWKQNFIQSNGLVNHKRLVNNQITGTNEAVSEGQGYGMLLSVLLNDQATFNRIFEAANANMWDNGRKSYFKWSLPNGSQGAATDADLDIGLALVFADELQKASLWQSYNKNGITYNSRAMDIIKSIKANMVSGNHLLPGDNWGGDGVNNLNPSYFATAWLKVFNAYQKEVDFTAVIDDCYSVLSKVPHYSKGQAPDWCNPNGGQASQAGSKPEQGLGMLSDGIRTPWRIGMDALWFNDARAIAYCKNTQKTLTDYANTNKALVAAQMSHYNKAGTSVVDTRGSFDNIAIWSVAVLGSKDTSYTRKVADSQVLYYVTGNSSEYFGTNELQDDKFYYKQSIAMLSFAAIGGQFPNVLADPKLAVGVISKPSARGSAAMDKQLFRNGTPVWRIPAAGSADAQYRNALGRAARLLP